MEFPQTQEKTIYSIYRLKKFRYISPIVPGHVMICPKRVVPRVEQLNKEEVIDLALSCHKVAPVLQKHFNATALNISTQDGPDAGQSIPHVHYHILPRKPNDFPNTDDIYKELQKDKQAMIDDALRKKRSIEEMQEECLALRKLFPDNQPQD